MIAILATALALQSAPADPGGHWGSFSRSPALRLMSTTIDVGTLGFDRKKGRLEYWLRRTVVQRGRTTIEWANSQTCPSVRPVLGKMQRLPVPPLGVPGYSGEGNIVLDGIGYSLKAPSLYGTISFDSNVGTPLAEWVEASLKALETCWTGRMPQRVDRR